MSLPADTTGISGPPLFSSMKSRITLARSQPFPLPLLNTHPKAGLEDLPPGERCGAFQAWVLHQPQLWNFEHRLPPLPQHSLSCHDGKQACLQETAPALSMCGPFSLSLSAQCSQRNSYLAAIPHVIIATQYREQRLPYHGYCSGPVRNEACTCTTKRCVSHKRKPHYFIKVVKW